VDVELSCTSTIFGRVGQNLVGQIPSHVAIDGRVAVVTLTFRHPSSGANTMNRVVSTPLRSYS